jgi:CheY-like chemotaxis protein
MRATATAMRLNDWRRNPEIVTQAQVSPTAQTGIAVPPEERSDKGMKGTILIVDDNADIATIIQGILEKETYNVRCVHSGHEALAVLTEEKPDLVILDMMMPQMDGYEVLKRIRANPPTSSVAVCLLTVRAQYEDILEAYKLGADYYITKPFTRAQIVQCVDSLLKKTAA